MSDLETSSTRRNKIRKRLIFTIVLLLAAAAVVYFNYVRDHGPKHLKLALITWTEDPFWGPLVSGAKDYAKDGNVDLTVILSKPTVEAQTQHIRDVLAAGIDGIAISPNDAEAQQAILNEATSKVPVVTFDTDAADSNRRRFVSIDNYAAGRVAAGELVDALPEGGPVIISVGSVTQKHGRDRRQGVIDGLLERGFDRNRASDPLEGELKGKKFTVVATALDSGDPAKSLTAIAAALKAHPETKGIIGLFSYSAPAALEAIKQAGAGKLQVIGFDESDETQAALEAGAIHSSILQESFRCGSETVRALADEARGVARGPAELSPILNVGINVVTGKDLPDLRTRGLVRVPAGAGKAP